MSIIKAAFYLLLAVAILGAMIASVVSVVWGL